MVIVQLIGGLGNQMFQYAAGCALAQQHGVCLKFDVSMFDTYDLRPFSLGVFTTRGTIASRFEIANLKFGHQDLMAKSLRFFFKKPRPFSEKFYKQPSFRYDSRFKDLTSDTYLIGSFQSEKYFNSVAGDIRKAFRPKAPLHGVNEEYSAQIVTCNSVSVHVRRGDYVSNSRTNAYHGVCCQEYYKNAISLIAGNVSQPVFYFFSDDIEWVKDNMHINYPMVFVGHNGPDLDYEDLRLMSLCKHNVIANSSFSWWGAWLNHNLGKIVVAPQQWFAAGQLDTQDLLPDGWFEI